VEAEWEVVCRRCGQCNQRLGLPEGAVYPGKPSTRTGCQPFLTVTQTVKTESKVPVTTLITEPVSGNIIVAGFADGKVKLYDLRQARTSPLLTWTGDAGHPDVTSKQSICKVGIVLGESTNVTSAWLGFSHDLRYINRLTPRQRKRNDQRARYPQPDQNEFLYPRSPRRHVIRFLPSTFRSHVHCQQSRSKFTLSSERVQLIRKLNRPLSSGQLRTVPIKRFTAIYRYRRINHFRSSK